MHRLTSIFLILLSLIAGFWSDGVVAQQPQDLQRIVALVNDEVISVRDLMERTRVIMVTGNLPDPPEVRRAVRDQPMRSMIYERMELQAEIGSASRRERVCQYASITVVRDA